MAAAGDDPKVVLLLAGAPGPGDLVFLRDEAADAKFLRAGAMGDNLRLLGATGLSPSSLPPLFTMRGGSDSSSDEIYVAQ